MTQIDQFESIFRAASKSVFQYEDWDVSKIVTVSDGSQADADNFCQNAQSFLSHAFDVGGTEANPIEWKTISGSEFDSVDSLIKKIENESPSVICSHRNLHIPANEYPYSLGVYIDVLTQAANAPVLLLPHPQIESNL